MIMRHTLHIKSRRLVSFVCFFAIFIANSHVRACLCKVQTKLLTEYLKAIQIVNSILSAFDIVKNYESLTFSFET